MSPNLSSKHRATLARVLAVPTPASIPWRDIEALFVALGATIEEAAGSRVLIRLGDRRAVFHRPHPRPEAKRGAVRAAKAFLKAAGVHS